MDVEAGAVGEAAVTLVALELGLQVKAIDMILQKLFLREATIAVWFKTTPTPDLVVCPLVVEK